MRIKLTEKQNKILNYIISFKEVFGYSPSIREISDNFNMNIKGAYDHLKALIRKKYILMVPRVARSIQILEEYEEYE
jgi:repressor LexA